MELVQNMAAHMLMGASSFHYMTPILSELYWLSVFFHAQLKVLVLTYKSLYGLGVRYLKGCLFQCHQACMLSLVEEAVLCVLSRKAFLVVAALIWN